MIIIYVYLSVCMFDWIFDNNSKTPGLILIGELGRITGMLSLVWKFKVIWTNWFLPWAGFPNQSIQDLSLSDPTFKEGTCPN